METTSRQTIIRFVNNEYDDITSGIYSGSSVLTEILDDSEELDFIGCNANSFECKLAGLSDKSILGKKIRVSQKIKENETVLFTGIVESADYEANKTHRKIVAYDEMYTKSNINITNWYTEYFKTKGSVKLSIFRKDLFEYIGLEQEDITLVNDNILVEGKATGTVKFGTVISEICQINGVFGNINRYGKFEYVSLDGKEAKDITDNVRSNGKVQDYSTIKISKVELYTDNEQIYYKAGAGNGFVVYGNSLLYGKKGGELKTIAENLLNKIKDITYTPVDMRTIIADISLKPGDKIKFTERSGKTVYTYILRNKLSSIQMLSQEIVANGSEARKEVAENNSAELSKLERAVVQKLDAYEAELTYATITALNATNATVEGKLNANELEAQVAEFGYLKADAAALTYATINNLNAANANISDLNATVAKTNTLIFGSATGEVIQTSFANSVIAQLGEAQIVSAMIKDLDVSKINAGILYTNKISIYGDENANLKIQDNTISISDGAVIRVQIGKDAQNDYNFYVWDKDGKLMFDALGLTEDGINRQVIDDDAVKDNANISAEKINRSSLFNVLNADGSETLKSSKIYFDDEGQTLDISFKSMTTKVNSAVSAASSADTNASSAVTVANNAKNAVDDLQDRADSGEFNGEDATLIYIHSSEGTAFKNDAVSTVMTITIYYGNVRIRNQTDLEQAYGAGSYLQWSVRKYGDSGFSMLLSSDTRLSDGGFTLTVGADDIDTQAVFAVELITPD